MIICFELKKALQALWQWIDSILVYGVCRVFLVKEHYQFARKNYLVILQQAIRWSTISMHSKWREMVFSQIYFKEKFHVNLKLGLVKNMKECTRLFWNYSHSAKENYSWICMYGFVFVYFWVWFCVCLVLGILWVITKATSLPFCLMKMYLDAVG